MPRRSRAAKVSIAPQPLLASVIGGRLKPLYGAELRLIVSAALDILERIGIADAPDVLSAELVAQGAELSDDNRLCFPRGFVQDAVARAPDRVDLPAFRSGDGLTIGGQRVPIGTGGAAVQVLDAETSGSRDAALVDLLNLMQVADSSENTHYGVRPVLAWDISVPLELDLKTAFDCLKGAAKPIGVSFQSPANLDAVVSMFETALGPEGAFRRRPFCIGVIVHVVPPLRFAADGIEILQSCVRVWFHRSALPGRPAPPVPSRWPVHWRKGLQNALPD